MQVTPFWDHYLCRQFSALGQRLGLTKRCGKHLRPLVAAPSEVFADLQCDIHRSRCAMVVTNRDVLCGISAVIRGQGFFFGYSLCSFSSLNN